MDLQHSAAASKGNEAAVAAAHKAGVDEATAALKLVASRQQAEMEAQLGEARQQRAGAEAAAEAAATALETARTQLSEAKERMEVAKGMCCSAVTRTSPTHPSPCHTSACGTRSKRGSQ